MNEPVIRHLDETYVPPPRSTEHLQLKELPRVSVERELFENTEEKHSPDNRLAEVQLGRNSFTRCFHQITATGIYEGNILARYRSRNITDLGLRQLWFHILLVAGPMIPFPKFDSPVSPA